MSHTQAKDSTNVFIILEKEVLLDLLKDGRTSLEESGTLRPMLFIELSNGEGIISPLQMPDESDEKYRMFYEIGRQIRLKFGAIQNAVTMSETWTVYANEAPDATKYPPSQHPCRREAILLVGRNADKTRSACVIQTFTRDEHNAPVWSEPQVMISDSGKEGTVTQGIIDALFDDCPPK